jgi:hypothetical protein
MKTSSVERGDAAQAVLPQADEERVQQSPAQALDLSSSLTGPGTLFRISRATYAGLIRWPDVCAGPPTSTRCGLGSLREPEHQRSKHHAPRHPSEHIEDTMPLPDTLAIILRI